MRRWIGAMLPVILALIAFVACKAGALSAINLENVAQQSEQLSAAADARPLAAVALYILVFSVLTGACLPVALTLTLAAGMVFGAFVGGAATAVAATSGAILTYLAARSSLAARVARKVAAKPRLSAFLERARRSPFFLILAARLMPLFPFAPLNVAAGMAAVPIRPFALATLVGAVPTSLAYAAIGAGLERTFRAGELSLEAVALSPGIAGSLTALALISTAAFVIQRQLPGPA